MIYVTGMFGLGDSMYMRPIVKELVKRGPVTVETPWPFLFNDIEDVYTTPARTNLRTQLKSMRTAQYKRPMATVPISQKLYLRYKGQEIQRGVTILESLARAVDVSLPDEIDMSIPALRGRWARRRAFIRPVTLRKEWLNSARAPKTEYLAQVAQWVQDDGYTSFCISDTKLKEEWVVDPPPPADYTLTKGEMPALQMLTFAAASEILIGGVGFLVPLALASKTPLFCLLGGNGAYNHPSILVDPRVDSRMIGWATPDNFCMCTNDRHECDKTISGLRGYYDAWRGHDVRR